MIPKPRRTRGVAAKNLLVFAHTPPPHHGQSYMVARLLEELRLRPECGRVFHVNSRVSSRLEDVGKIGIGKLWRWLGYCAKAIYLRCRYGRMLFYYVPAPAQRAAIYRDWVAMILCRPFFQGGLILHWHALGLGERVRAKAGGMESWLTRRLLGGAALSLVLAPSATEDQAIFEPTRTLILPNGIRDPVPDFTFTSLAGERRQRQLAFRAKLDVPRGSEPGAPAVFEVLFLAHCTREKGLYDALEIVRHTNRQLAEAAAHVRCRLTVAGRFLTPLDQATFEGMIRDDSDVVYAGFAAGAEKDRLFRRSDCFLFPTYYANEVMPVALIEALAYGLPIITTRWRAIPEMLPAGNGCRLIEPRQPTQGAEALRAILAEPADMTAALRQHFTENYGSNVFGARFAAALEALR